jgi:aldehyde:ferredoxin oxidoreductase
MVAVCDTLGFCFFVGPVLDNMVFFANLINAKYGYSCSAIDLIELGRKVIMTEIDYNKRSGIPTISRLPEFFYDEKSEPKGYTFDIEAVEVEKIWDQK